MENDTLDLWILILAIIVVIYIFIKIALRIRKHGGSMITTMHASTYEFLNKDKREAVEEVVEMKANKKMEEEASDEPKE